MLKKIYIKWFFLLFSTLLVCSTFIYLKFFYKQETEPLKNLIVGRYTDSISLDPSIATDSESFQVSVNIFENLVRLDSDGLTMLPSLAESWRSSEDGLTWNFMIRSNVTFQDGTPLNADAVVFNFQRWMNDNNPYHTGQFTYWNQSFGGFPGMVKSVIAISEYNVEIILSEPYAPFLNVLSLPSFGIASPESIKKYNENMKFHPVGTGPFVLDHWDLGREVVLKRNESYWGKKAALDGLVFRVIDKSADIVELFKSSKLHILEGAQWSDKEKIEIAPHTILRYKPMINVSYLALNHTIAPFDDIRVRKAIGLLLDRDEIISEALTPLSKPASTFLPPQSKSYHEGIKPLPQNIEEAKKLLKEAGFEKGFNTTLWVSSTSRDYMTNPITTSNIIRDQLKQANINVHLKVLSWTDFLSSVKKGEHPMVLAGWNGDLLDPDNFLYTLFYSENTKPDLSLNYFFYKNTSLDHLLKTARHTLNEEFRISLYRDAQEMIYNDFVGYPLVHTMSLCAIDYRVKNYKPSAIGHQWLYNVDFR